MNLLQVGFMGLFPYLVLGYGAGNGNTEVVEIKS